MLEYNRIDMFEKIDAYKTRVTAGVSFAIVITLLK